MLNASKTCPYICGGSQEGGGGKGGGGTVQDPTNRRLSCVARVQLEGSPNKICAFKYYLQATTNTEICGPIAYNEQGAPNGLHNE